MVGCGRSERPHADQRPLIEPEPERGSGSLAVGRRFTTRCRATIGWPTFTPGKLDQNAMPDSGPRSGVTQPGHSRGNFGRTQLPPIVDGVVVRAVESCRFDQTRSAAHRAGRRSSNDRPHVARLTPPPGPRIA